MPRRSAQSDIDVAEIAEALRAQPEAVLRRIGWEEKCRRRNTWTAASIHGGVGTKVCAWLDGQRRGTFTCFNGPQIAGRSQPGGDMLTLLAGVRGQARPTRAVLNEALDILGRAPLGEKEDANAVRERKIEREKHLAAREERDRAAAADLAQYRAWIRERYRGLVHKARDVDLVRAYLEGRGIDPALLPGWIRFDPACRYRDDDGKVLGLFPAMIAPMIDSADPAARRILALHLTYLGPDGAGKLELRDAAGDLLTGADGKPLPAKKIQASPSGGGIEIGSPAPPARVLAVTEGIENALSVKMLRPGWMVWAAGAVGIIPDLTIPRAIDRLVFVEDGDSSPAKNADGSIRRHADGSVYIPAREAVREAAEAAARQRQASGRLLDVRRVLCPPGTDFNDLVAGMAAGTASALGAGKGAV